MNNKQRRVLRIVILVVVLICLVGGGALLVLRKKQEIRQTQAFGTQPRPVTAVKAVSGDLTLDLAYLAVVEPAQQAVISARVSSTVESVRVDEGDRVEAGQVLAELDAREIEQAVEVLTARIEQAEAELAGNQATIEALKESEIYWQAEKRRDSVLAEKGAVSTSEAEQTAQKAAEVRGQLRATEKKSRAIEKQIETLQIQQAELRIRRGYYTLTSPFAGVVTQRLTDTGDLAAPARQLFEVQDRSMYKVAFDLPQKDLPSIQEGQTVTYTVNDGSRKASIQLLEPSISPAKMMRAEVWLEGEAAAELTPGAYLPITVQVQQLDDVILIPASALIEAPQGETHVFAVEEGKLAACAVHVLGRTADRVAVSGIEADTQVVANSYLGWATLSSGQTVEVVE